jgi:DTW domain-containing protein YfiP
MKLSAAEIINLNKPMQHKLFEYTQSYMKEKLCKLQQSNRCTDCFMTKGLCICSQIKSLFADSGDHFDANILLFMHHREWGRASNTGKLLQIGLPKKCTLTIYGVEEQQNKMIEKLINSKSVVLYPCKTSVPISNYKEWFSLNDNANICILDATWPQSHSMEQCIPQHIPRVHINDCVDGPSLFLNRKQSKTVTKVVIFKNKKTDIIIQ